MSLNNRSNKDNRAKKLTDQVEKQINDPQTSANITLVMRKLPNGIPITITFAVVLFVIAMIEIKLAEYATSTVLIEVSNSDNSEEVESQIQTKKINSDAVIATAKEIYDLLTADDIKPAKNEQVTLPSKKTSSNLLAFINRSTLSCDDINDSLKLALQYMFKERRYSQTSSVLGEIPIAQRITRQIQFGYALSLSKQKKFKAATEAYKALLREEPNHHAATLNLGGLLIKQGELEHAERLYNKVISKLGGVRKSKAFAGAAKAQHKLGKLELAIENYQKAIEYRPSKSSLWIALANVSSNQFTQLSLTTTRFEQAIALEKNDPKLRQNYALFLIRQLKIEQAVTQLKIAKKLARDDFEIRYLLAFCYSQIAKPVNSRKQLKLAEKFAKRKSQKVQLQALGLHLDKEWRNSLELSRTLLKKNRNNELDYLLVSLNYLELNKPKNARLYRAKIENISVFYALGQFLHAEYLHSRNDSAAAYELISKMTEAFVNNVMLQSKAARYALDGQLLDKAEEHITLALAQNSQLPLRNRSRIELLRAEIAWKSQHRQKAISLLEALVASDPNYFRAYYRLASYNQQAGDTERAIIVFQALYNQRASYSDVEYQLAKLYFAKKSYLEAELMLERYIASNASSKAPRLLLARVFCELGQLEKCKETLQWLLKLAPDYQPALDYQQSMVNN